MPRYMWIALIALLASNSLSCSLSNPLRINKALHEPLLIDIRTKTSIVEPMLADQSLIWEQGSISPWPLQVKPCNKCGLSVVKRFHPEGPTLQLTFENLTNKMRWTIIDTRQSVFQLQNVTAQLAMDKFIDLFKVNNVRYSLTLGQTIKIENCYWILPWLEKKTQAQNSMLSDDRAKQRIQLISVCSM